MFACLRRAQPVAYALHSVRRVYGQPRRRADVINVSEKPRKGIQFMVESRAEPVFGWNKRSFMVVTAVTCVALSAVAYRKYKNDKRERQEQKFKEELEEVKQKSMGGLPRPLVVVGPPGVGKTTLIRKLIKEFPNSFGFCVWHTTREMRRGEVDGKDFHFISPNEMSMARENGVFLETAKVGDIEYATSKHAIADVKNSGRICLLDTSMEAVKALKKTDLEPIFVYINPPPLQVLEERLGKERAMMAYKAQAASKLFDFVIVNDKLDEAYEQLKAAISNELDLCRLLQV